MKNVPKKIYLQVDDGKGKIPPDFEMLTHVSWCSDRIHKPDLVYYLRKRRIKKVKKM